MRHLIYYVSGPTRYGTRHYVRETEVKRGEMDREALARRKEEHQAGRNEMMEEAAMENRKWRNGALKNAKNLKAWEDITLKIFRKIPKNTSGES